MIELCRLRRSAAFTFLPSFSHPRTQRSGSRVKRRNLRDVTSFAAVRQSAAVSQISTRGRNGFDGGTEAGSAGGCARHPKNGQL